MTSKGCLQARLHRADEPCRIDLSATAAILTAARSSFRSSAWGGRGHFGVVKPKAGWRRPLPTERSCPLFVALSLRRWEATMGKGVLMWLVGIPIPVIIVLYLIFH